MRANPLREWRQARNLSKLEIALKLDLSEQTIHCYETGRFEPSRQNVDKLSELMGITPAQFRLNWHFWKENL